jgi:histidyl-tRNA synthetase
VSDFLNTIEFKNELLDEGAAELRQIFEILAVGSVLTNVSFVFNPSIARGLDYYTGTVYETTLDGLESYGSICSGGSYSDLASRFTNQKLPGVGMSLGLTRLLSILKEENLKKFDNQTKSDVLVCLLDDQQLLVSLQIAASLRRESLNVEVNYKPAIGLGKQLEQGSAKGIGYALVCELDGQLTLFDLHTNEKVTFSGFEALSQHLNAKKQS